MRRVPASRHQSCNAYVRISGLVPGTGVVTIEIVTGDLRGKSKVKDRYPKINQQTQTQQTQYTMRAFAREF